MDNLRLERSWLGEESSSLLDLRYTYDLAGNVATLDDVERGETATFTYDERDRLVSAGGPYQETYAYSPMGNVLTRTVEGEARGYTYGETVVISQTEAPPSGLQVRAYLPLVARASGPAYPPLPDATTGQPFAVETQGGNQYAYDANGNMVLRVVVGDTETTIYTQEFDVENRLTGADYSTGESFEY